MSQNYSDPTFTWNYNKANKNKWKSPLINVALFFLTLITTTIAGAEWASSTGGPMEFSVIVSNGLPYALAILFFLSAHEFGHYFASKYHGVDATLPYYIPFPPIPFFLNFGTLGAVIKTRSRVPNNKIMFDIGVAGPIAGFIASVIILFYGFTHLPGAEYILSIHPDYFDPEYSKDSLGFAFGDSLLFSFFRNLFADPNSFIPPMSEIYHYPYLCVGWFGLFVTTMNMIPVGQLDGGHVIFGMFGIKKHEAVASISMILLILLGVMGVLDSFLELNINIGWSGWLFWSFILYFFIKVKHPPVQVFEKLSTGRMILGFISLLILILSFSPNPFVITIPAGI